MSCSFWDKSKIYGGEIIMNKIGSAGKFWMMPDLNRPVSLGLNQLMIRLSSLNSWYVYYYLSTNYAQMIINSKTRGATTKSITKAAVKSIPIMLPPINQQEKFAVAIPMLTKQVSVMRQQQLSQSKILDSYARARQHVEELKGFYFSLAAYCIVIPSLYFIWYKFTPFTIQWFWFPMIGWGFGLTAQAFRVFVNNGKFGRSWEQRKIDQFMREEEQEKRWN